MEIKIFFTGNFSKRWFESNFALVPDFFGLLAFGTSLQCIRPLLLAIIGRVGQFEFVQ
jgi:hypothetical protein